MTSLVNDLKRTEKSRLKSMRNNANVLERKDVMNDVTNDVINEVIDEVKNDFCSESF